MCKSSGRDTIAAVAFLFYRKAYIILLEKQVAHLFCPKTKNSRQLGPAPPLESELSQASTKDINDARLGRLYAADA